MLTSIEKIEKERLISLMLTVVKGRWYFLVFFLIYGLSLSVLVRVLEYRVLVPEDMPILQWIGTSFLIIYNLTFWLFLKSKKAFNLTSKQLKIFSFFQIIFDIILIVFFVYSTADIEGPAIPLLVIPIVIASIFFSPRGVVLVTFLTMASTGAMVLGRSLGYLKDIRLYAPEMAPNFYSNPAAVVYSFSAVLIVSLSVAVYFYLSSGIIRKAEDKLKNLTQELTQERDKIEAVVTNLTDSLILLDSENRIILLNPEAKGTLGVRSCAAVSKEDCQIEGKKIDQVTKDFPHIKKLYEALEEKIEWTGKKYEVVLERPLTRYFTVQVSPVVSRDDKRIGSMIIMHDITREKELDRLKTEFVSIAAHQLRTPLSAIKWTLKMVLAGDVGKITSEQAEILDQGYQSNERMISLVNDLLNVARIEEGRLLYEMKLISLEKIIDKYIQELSPLIQKNNLKFNFLKPAESLVEVEADEEKISLVIQNLMENALKYTSTGKEVTISLKSDKINVEFMIKDSGIGIPDDQQDRMFTKFFRGVNAMKAGIEGSGMGLFICKSVIEKHGGRIWFESEEGKGTTFWFTLPIKTKRKN